MGRQELIARTFVELADTLVEDFDPIEFLQRMTVLCRDILDVADTAVFLGHPGSRLYSPAPCDPGPGLQRVLDTAIAEGPALEAWDTARQIVPDPTADAAPSRWPQFDAHLRQAGYAPASAVPMRLRKDSIGALLLLPTGTRALSPDDLRLAQAFADVATIGLLHARALSAPESITGQLHTALHDRITIEQAKGVLAARRNVSLNQAFDAMREHAGRHEMLLGQVAREVIDNGLLPAGVVPRPQTTPDS